MLRLLPRFFYFVICVFITASASAQSDTTQPTSVDPELLALETGKIPKEYSIRSINITGINFLDTAIVQSISGLQVGDKIMLPGGRCFFKSNQQPMEAKIILQHPDIYYGGSGKQY